MIQAKISNSFELLAAMEENGDSNIQVTEAIQEHHLPLPNSYDKENLDMIWEGNNKEGTLKYQEHEFVDFQAFEEEVEKIQDN